MPELVQTTKSQSMDVDAILVQLRRELEFLEHAILRLELQAPILVPLHDAAYRPHLPPQRRPPHRLRTKLSMPGDNSD